MSTIALRRMRIWLLVLVTLSAILVIAKYSYAAANLGALLRLIWKDWAVIISIVILFFSYIYAFKGQPRLHKYLRAFLILIPTIMLLYVNFDYLARYLDATSTRPQQRFVCPFGNASCLLHWSLVFVSVIMGVFVLIEVGMTLAWGPLQKTHQYGGALGYAQDANVIVVSPDQPQQQLYYPQQPLQQQGYYPQQQALIPMQQQPQLYQYQQPIALDPNPQYQQQQQQQPTQLYQQQQYQYSSSPAPVPGTTAAAVVYPQSPITASGEYQQQ
ncbi:hypothetical protein BGW39_007978 [Mortierella sp. 14UC]|nr:hypothetical protein BGW39_007978 [Mortierella sp. 14UC]